MRFTTSVLVGCALAAALLAAGCRSEDGVGPIRSETRTVPPFDRVNIDGRADVVIRRDARQTLTLRSEQRILDEVETTVSDRTLTIESDVGADPLEVTVTVSRLLGVDADGAGEIGLVDVDSEELELRLDGAGELTASGRVAALDAVLDGAGELQLGRLWAQRATVRVDGIGRAEVSVAEELAATVTGVGAIEYHGDPTVLSHVPGLGDVSRASS